MTVEWVDVEEPPAPGRPTAPPTHRRAALLTPIVVAVLAVVAAVLGIALVGQESVVTGHGAGALPLGVLLNPDDPSTGTVVLGHAVGSITYPDAHAIVYVIGLRNTRTTPARIARVAVHVSAADRRNVIGVRVVTMSDSAMTTPLTPPASLEVIQPGDTAGVWVALRYACGPHGLVEIPHPTVTITTDPHDSLQIGPDDGLVAPHDAAAQFACDTRVH